MATYTPPESLHVGTGSETVFGFNWPYLLPTDLVVSLNGLSVPTVLATTNQVVITPTPAAGAIVRIYRNTPAQDPTYLFASGIPMLPRYIDGNNKQLLYALQEGLLQFSLTDAIAREALQNSATAVATSAAAWANTERAIRTPLNEPPIPPIAGAAARARKVLGFDSEGNPVGTLPATGSGTELALDLAGPGGSALVGTVRPEVGAVTRKVATSLRDQPPTPQDFGAVGDGVTLCTDAFVKAQAAGVVQVPDGVYLVDGSQLNVAALRGGPGAILKFTTGQRVALDRVGTAEALEQVYWQEVQAAPGTTHNLNTTQQALGICEGVVYMAQNVLSPSGTWAHDSIVRMSSFPLNRAATDDVDVTVTGGVAPTAVVDLEGLGHGAGASVIREGGKLWLYSTVSTPPGVAPVKGVNCNYGTGFTKVEWKGAATAGVQSYRNLQGVFNAEVCVSACGSFLVFVGSKFLPVVRDTTNYAADVPFISVFDRGAVEAAVNPATVPPLHAFAMPFVEASGSVVGSPAGIACDGEFVYILNSGAQVVGGRTVTVMSLSGELVKAFPVSGWAGIQPTTFREGTGGKHVFAYEIEGLAFHNETLMMLSKFNVCTPQAVVGWQGKSFIPVRAGSGTSPQSFASWARSEAPATEQYDHSKAYLAPTALVYHKYLTALAPKGRITRPHPVAAGLYMDCQSGGYQGVYSRDSGYTVNTHFFVGQHDRNTDTTWPLFEYRSSGLGRLYHCDQVKGGAGYDTASFYGRISYDYGTGTLLSGGPSVGTGATLTLCNSRDTSTGDRYGVLHAQGGRAMLWGVHNVSYKNFNPNIDATLNVGSAAHRWNVAYFATGSIHTSDARAKTPVRKLTPAEIRAAQALGAETGVYQWLEQLVAKDGDARLHIGMTVQRAIEIMRSHGLDPMCYGFICYDKWDATPAEYDRVPAVLDEKDNVLEEEHMVLITEARPAGDKFSFRMGELYAFISAGQHARQNALEERLRQLEAKL